MIVPTAASNDAPCTSVAVLYNDAGVVIKALVTKHDPELILVDTELIAQAPERLFACGLGDALSTYFEARACQEERRQVHGPRPGFQHRYDDGAPVL